MKLIRLILIFCLVLIPLAAQAGFFEDLFGLNKAPVTDPYTINVRDTSGDAGVVSHSAKAIKLKIFYPVADQTKIEALTNGVLNSALADALTVMSINAETDTQTELNDLGFTIRFKAVKSKYQDMLEIQYISKEIVLDQVQRLTFSFNAKQYLRLINLVSNLKSNTATDTLYIRPIVISFHNQIIDSIISLDNPVESASVIDNYGFVADFDDIEGDPIMTDVSNGDISFSYKVNGKSRVASLKAGTKTYNPELVALSPELATNASTATCHLVAPFTLTVTELLSAGSYSLTMPLELETQTTSGLKVLVRGVAKGKLAI